jgi:hypothetical protein
MLLTATLYIIIFHSVCFTEQQLVGVRNREGQAVYRLQKHQRKFPAFVLDRVLLAARIPCALAITSERATHVKPDVARAVHVTART